MEFDMNKKHCFYFREISNIPRGSGNEKGIADYVENFAKEHGFEYRRDELHNVIVYRPAAKGRENEDGVILQGHMDMICEKNADVEFDFEKDPIDFCVIDDKWLTARGTTLGADDGYGIAYMLTLLDDPDLNAPMLECIFTVQEEVGLIGAKALKADDIRAKRYINLDGGGEVTTTVSNSGGRRVSTGVAVEYEDCDKEGYRVFLTGLKGGHSGGVIDKNRGNSNKIMARILKAVSRECCGFALSSLSGGLKENAIPREAEAVFVSDCCPMEVINKTVDYVKSELAESDPGLTVSVEKVKVSRVMKNSMNVVNFIFLAPNGFVAPSMAIPGLTLASLNLGVVRTYDDRVEANYQMRSPVKGFLEELTEKMLTLGELFGASVEVGAEYPGWSFEPVSPMRDLLRAVLKERGIELEEKATHGGLECGYFKALEPELDIITYGPVATGAHTPDEMMDLESFDRCFAVLKEILEKC